MKGYEKEGTGRVLGEVQPKLEHSDPAPAMANLSIHGEAPGPHDTIRADQRGSASKIDPVETPDLNLSLQPFCPKIGVFDLNVEPQEEDSDLVEEPHLQLLL